MAVLPQFQDPGPPAYANAFFGGMSQGLSIVERKQRMKLNEQRQNLEQMEFIAKLPLIQADAQLRIEQARSAIATGIQQTNLEAKAALDAPVAQGEFFRVMQQDDAANSEDYTTIDPELDSPEQQAEITARNEEIKKYATKTTLENRANQLASLMTKYSYMKNLKDPGYAGYYDTLEKSYVETNKQLHAFIQYDALLARTQESADARMYGANRSFEGRVYAANVGAENAQVAATSRVDAAKERTQRTYELETTMKLREEARQRKDVEAFAIYDARLKKLNHIPQSAGEAVANALAGPAETAAAPEAAAPKPPATRDPYIRGTIYKDTKGRRAKYLGNGQWQKLD